MTSSSLDRRSSRLSPILIAGALCCLPLSAWATETRRVAVVVGANKAVAGLQPLKFSYQDAQSIADVLVQAGDFKRSDVHVLLDPNSADVILALDAELEQAVGRREETMLLFYYSGHADENALYPNGQSLPFAVLRPRLESADAAVRVGIVDACGGGAWTRSKGLHPEAPFAVQIPLEMSTEGSVLIASTSGIESAHEADALQGSFFTHHLVAGLRGAAARSTDPAVSLHDAFAYAQRLTIRDTARYMQTPQHASFDMHLRGRNDIALTRVDSSTSIVALQQREGPLQVVQLSTGVVVLELPGGARSVRLALPPGEYLVRRRTPRQTWARQIAVEPNRSVAVDEGSLELTGEPALASKEFRRYPDALQSTVTAKHVELTINGSAARSDYVVPNTVGNPENLQTQLNALSVASLYATATWGITDRLQLSLPAPVSLSSDGISHPVLSPTLAYRFGDIGGMEWIPWITASKVFHPNYLVQVSAGVFARKWFSMNGSLNIGGGMSSAPSIPFFWISELSVGWSQTFDNRVTLNFSSSLQVAGSSVFASFGGVQWNGRRQLPLIQVHLSPSFTLDGSGSVGVAPGGTFAVWGSLGLSYTF